MCNWFWIEREEGRWIFPEDDEYEEVLVTWYEEEKEK